MTAYWSAALCRDEPELWYSDDPQDKALAIATCRTCPLMDDCLADTQARESGKGKFYRFGIAGGLTPLQRFDLSTAAKVPAPRPPCGTTSGHYWHTKNGETCDKCNGARSAQRRRSRTKKAVALICVSSQKCLRKALRTGIIEASETAPSVTSKPPLNAPIDLTERSA